MRFHITAKTFESIHRAEDVRKLRESVGKAYGRLKESGKMVDGGVLADQRAFYFVLNIENASDIHELLGPEVLDHCTVEAHPVASFDDLGKFLDKITREGR